MSFIPTFELGLWNAWIFWLYFVLAIVPNILIFRVGAQNEWKKAMDREFTSIPHNKTQRTLQCIGYIVYLIVIMFSMFSPLKLDTIWFYCGVMVFLLGVIFDIMATISFATTPFDKPVTNGIYSISRNPQDFSAFLIIIGMGIASASWILLLLAIVSITLMNSLLVSEERWCLEKYGDSYRKYKNKTPRWMGIPKIKRKK